MVGLQAVLQHRSVDLGKDVGADLDYVVGADAEDVGVERRVVNLTKGQAVAHDRIPVLVTIRQDVRGVEQLDVPQVAHAALVPVRA